MGAERELMEKADAAELEAHRLTAAWKLIAELRAAQTNADAAREIEDLKANVKSLMKYNAAQKTIIADIRRAQVADTNRVINELVAAGKPLTTPSPMDAPEVKAIAAELVKVMEENDRKSPPAPRKPRTRKPINAPAPRQPVPSYAFHV